MANLEMLKLKEWLGEIAVKPVLSPWALHFGAGEGPFFRTEHPDGRSHSGLAPELPRMEPHDYNGPSPPLTGSLPEPSPEEMDRLFVEERVQKETFGGLKSFEVMALNQRLYGGFPGRFENTADGWDTWEIYLRSVITVDESKWFRFLKKPRWFDLRHDIKTKLRNPIPPVKEQAEEAIWSVDYKPVWDALRVALELVDRIFKLLIQEEDEWYELISLLPHDYVFPTHSGLIYVMLANHSRLLALLSSNIAPWDYDSQPARFKDDRTRFHLHPADGGWEAHKFKCPPPRSPHASYPDTATEALEAYLEGMALTFMDEDSYNSPAWGITSPNFVGNDTPLMIVVLHAAFIRPLLEEETTVAERCAAIFGLATTVGA